LSKKKKWMKFKIAESNYHLFMSQLTVIKKRRNIKSIKRKYNIVVIAVLIWMPWIAAQMTHLNK
jgi:hypothetical protein